MSKVLDFTYENVRRSVKINMIFHDFFKQFSFLNQLFLEIHFAITIVCFNNLYTLFLMLNAQSLR